jgi:hypothetical protein
MAYSNQDINWFIGQQGIADNPYAIYANAQRYGVNGGQIDSARGWAGGTADAWVRDNGLNPLGTGPYGYGQSPSYGGVGYYEQQTPAGSFAASSGSAPVRQQAGQFSAASNPYIGQTSQGIGVQQSVMPYAQQAASFAQMRNPWIGQTAAQADSVGQNAYSGGNPYLAQQIQRAQDETTRSFNNVARPAFDAAERASGSFGNTAIQEQRGNAYRDLGGQLGNIASSMRMQDYTQQQQLAEAALNRQQQNNQFNASLGAADLARNTAGFMQGQSLGLQGLSALLSGAQFDANLGQQGQQFNSSLGASDLARNAQLAQNLGQFNASGQSGMSQFNAGAGNALGQFNASLNQANNQFNAGAGNQLLSQYRQLGQQQNQFDQNMDFNTWQANNSNMRQGTQDQIALLNALLGMQGQGVNMANQQQNTPLNYWSAFSNAANATGGLGGSASQQMPGNPLLGGLAGWQLGSRIFGG